MRKQTLVSTRKMGLVLASVIGAMMVAPSALAGEVTYPDDAFSSGQTLKADDLNSKFNELKEDINDNNGRISALEGNAPPPSDLNELLKGTYYLVGIETCMEATGGISSPDLYPGIVRGDGTADFFGKAVFDGAGNAVLTLSTTSLVENSQLIYSEYSTDVPGILTTSSTCHHTYSVAADRTFSMNGNCAFDFTGGFLKGNTGTITGTQIRGYIGSDGKSILTSYVPGNIQHVSLSNGYEADRVCANKTQYIR